jgi:hypothetical protein
MPKKKKQEPIISEIQEIELVEKIESNQETISRLFHASIIGLSSFMILIFVFLFTTRTNDRISFETKTLKSDIENVHTVQLNIMEQIDSIGDKLDRNKVVSQELSTNLQELDKKMDKNYKKVNYVSETLDTLVMFIKK